MRVALQSLAELRSEDAEGVWGSLVGLDFGELRASLNAVTTGRSA